MRSCSPAATRLIPLMKLRFTRPSLLVDIGRIDELSYVRDAGEWLAIGALTRHQAIRDDPLVQEHCPIVSHTAGLIGDPQVRHRGTIGGSLAHCDPASDLPAVMLALDSEFVITGSDGERTVAARRVLPRRLRLGHRAGGDADGDPCAEARQLDRLVVPQVQPPGAGLGDGRRRRARASARTARGRGRPDRARRTWARRRLRATAVEQALVAGEADPAAYMADGTDPPPTPLRAPSSARTSHA